VGKVTNGKPQIQRNSTRIEVNGEHRTVSGVDLNSVLRGVLVQIRDDMGLSTAALARRLGLRQQSLSAMINKTGDRGFTLRLVSDICAAMSVSVGELFSLHPRYKSDSQDESWARIKSVTTAEQRDRLADLIQLSATLNLIDHQIDHSLAIAEAVAKTSGVERASLENRRA